MFYKFIEDQTNSSAPIAHNSMDDNNDDDDEEPSVLEALSDDQLARRPSFK